MTDLASPLAIYLSALCSEIRIKDQKFIKAQPNNLILDQTIQPFTHQRTTANAHAAYFKHKLQLRRKMIDVE